MPRPNTTLKISDENPDLKIKFRHPSPGSQPPVELRSADPSFGNAGEDPYDVSYYKRDTGRRYTSDPATAMHHLEKIKLQLLPEDHPKVKEALEEHEKGPGSSPGNKGMFATGKSDFDPTGLRATMSASYEATEASLDANMPDHVSIFSTVFIFPLIMFLFPCLFFCQNFVLFILKINTCSFQPPNGLQNKTISSLGTKNVICLFPLEVRDTEQFLPMLELQDGNF